MWNSVRCLALRNVNKGGGRSFKGGYLWWKSAERHGGIPNGEYGGPFCSTYSFSTLLSSRQVPQDRVGFKMMETESQSVSLEKNIKDAKELLELDSVSSLASLSLQSLFRNQADVIRTHMMKLVGSHHPILRLARDFYQENMNYLENANSSLDIFDERDSTVAVNASVSIQLRAIFVLLVTKIFGFPLTSRGWGSETEFAKNVLNKQRTIAEITEMMQTAYTLHQTIVNIPSHDMTTLPSWYSDPASISRLHDGNNLAALMGDLLLAKTSGGLSSLKNAVVTGLMTDTISNFAESQFVGLEILGSGKSAVTEELWLMKNRLGAGLLLRNACHSCLIFGGHEEPIINLGRHLGEQIGLLLQASKETSFYSIKTDEIPIQFDLCTLPVIHAVQSKHISIERLKELASSYDYEQIYNEIVLCKPALEYTSAMTTRLHRNIERMLTLLDSPNPEAARILINLIRSVILEAGQQSNAVKR